MPRSLLRGCFTSDLTGHYIDTAIPFALGIIGLIYYSRRIAKDITSGKRTEAEEKSRLRKIRIVCCMIMLLGVLKLTEFLK
jgi:hypothetical protein